MLKQNQLFNKITKKVNDNKFRKNEKHDEIIKLKKKKMQFGQVNEHINIKYKITKKSRLGTFTQRYNEINNQTKYSKGQ